MDKFKEKIKTCLQDEPAFCTAACPFHLDIRDFISKIQRGGFNAAYRNYLNAVGFPGIVSALCHEPCREVCPRQEKDQSINLRLLEKASVEYARNLDPNSYNMPPKDKKIAVIGAGISGLACALRLASKKYQVTVFEKSDRIGGHLWDLLSPEIFLADIERQFSHEEYELLLNREINKLEELKDFDAIYIATGKDGMDFGVKPDEGGAFAGKLPGVFLGGELVGKNIMEAIADGLQVVHAIERYLKTGAMNHPAEHLDTKIKMNMDLVPYEAAIKPKGESFSKDEAIAEAKRCLRCSCDACIRHCDLMCYFGKYPKRIDGEVEGTIHPGTLDGAGTIATRLISTCNQCGLCKEVCPQKIDTGDFLLKSHRIMWEKGAMPWAYHDFWLRDMAFTNGEEASVVRMPQGVEKSTYLFFPGCQLGASDPNYVTESYRYLLDHYQDTALMLGCCGAPAAWAGNEPLHEDVLSWLREKWSSLGQPTVVLACPTCKQMFQKYLPEIKTVFLLQLMAETGITSKRRGAGETVSVFDPCASRNEGDLQQSVREMVKDAEFVLEPLPAEGKYARCCSWGGQVSIADPAFAREVTKARVSQNNLPYIAYCVNCRDIFASAQKPVYHILDILFGLNDDQRKSPTYSERRKNRIDLKRQVLKEFWEEEGAMAQDRKEFFVDISPELKEKLNREMILESEIIQVIETCEKNSKKLMNPDTGHFSGHLKIGQMTYWVEYFPVDKGFKLMNAYSHRMSIEEA